LLGSGWFIPSDNIDQIVDRTLRRRSEARPAVVSKVLGEALLQLVLREEVERQLDEWLDQDARAGSLTRFRFPDSVI
jgi:hypothetical protein